MEKCAYRINITDLYKEESRYNELVVIGTEAQVNCVSPTCPLLGKLPRYRIQVGESAKSIQDQRSTATLEAQRFLRTRCPRYPIPGRVY